MAKKSETSGNAIKVFTKEAMERIQKTNPNAIVELASEVSLEVAKLVENAQKNGNLRVARGLISGSSRKQIKSFKA